MARSILIIDDEEPIRKSLSGAISDEGYRTRTAADGETGIEAIRKEAPDVVLLDIWMSGMDGLQTLSAIKNDWPGLPVIMMSGHGTIETAVKATKLGAFDFVEKPVELDRLLVTIRNAMIASELQIENQALRKQMTDRKSLLGESPAIAQTRDLIKRVAPTTGSVLITGENGTGKEVVARMIHALSQRFKEAFIEVNCAAIPEELIESELFGHERGAFTGAVQARKGRFDLADGGTIFLDEIGDMSLKTQAKVLRILQEQRFERVGGNATQQVDVRVIAATNKDLKAEIAAGNFREDLYYRLNVVPVHLPPLNQRGKDIEILADYFIEEFSNLHRKPKRKISAEAHQVLRAYPWPGNVRELRNLTERLVILQAPGEEAQAVTANELYTHLQQQVPHSKSAGGVEVTSPAINLKDARSEFEREFVMRALKENQWNVSKTAQALGIERSYLHRKMKAFGIEGDEN